MVSGKVMLPLRWKVVSRQTTDCKARSAQQSALDQPSCGRRVNSVALFGLSSHWIEEEHPRIRAVLRLVFSAWRASTGAPLWNGKRGSSGPDQPCFIVAHAKTQNVVARRQAQVIAAGKIAFHDHLVCRLLL